MAKWLIPLKVQVTAVSKVLWRREPLPASIANSKKRDSLVVPKAESEGARVTKYGPKVVLMVVACGNLVTLLLSR